MLAAGCQANEPGAAGASQNGPVIFYGWPGDMPKAILEIFKDQTGIQVEYRSFNSQEEAIQQIRGGAEVDLMVIENEFVPLLMDENLLAAIDYHHIPNFRNISPSFVDLSYDPKNEHSVPYNWGVCGLAVREDLAERPVTAWKDLWQTDWEGKVVLTREMRVVMGIVLKSLGYSANSEDPAELQQAEAHLWKLRDRLVLVDGDEAVTQALLAGEGQVGTGYAKVVRSAEQENAPLQFVSPEEGVLLWGDNLVIPANSQNKQQAEQFINFLLKPEISARLTRENYYATANDAARDYLGSAILSDPLIYPPREAFEHAEILLPVSAEGAAIYTAIWERFINED